MAEMTLTDALEKLALITKNGLDTLIQDSTNESITIENAIDKIKTDAVDICETGNYAIGGDGIKKIKDDGHLGNIVYRVIEDA